MVKSICSNDDEDSSSPSIHYFNNAAMARLLPDVKEAGIDAISNQMSSSNHNTNIVNDIRSSFAKLIGAEPSNIAINPSTAFAITLAAKNLEKQLHEKSIQVHNGIGKILVLQDQMCSAVYPWQDICDRSNGILSLEIIPHPDEQQTKFSNWTELILDRIENLPIVTVCLPPLHWSDGSLIDLEIISNVCRARGNIPFIVDATQAIGAYPCNIRSIQPTLLACSVHKWLRGPSGVSLVYINPTVYETWLPLDQHGRGRDLPGGIDWDTSRDEMGPNGYCEKFYNDARKFDSGGKPNPIILPMLHMSLQHVLRLDVNIVQERLKVLMEPFIHWVKTSNKFHNIPKNEHSYHLFGLRPINMTPQQMVQICTTLQNDYGIYIAVRCGVFRISPYIDNTTIDVQVLQKAFEEINM